ncbi:MAG: DEAD/DEAH box helicase family protein [Anaerolineales bacterium]|nr:DEAD/DEAH box helicase family protein [Anaerolineales bacterium]
MQTPDEIDQLLAAAREELSGLDSRREAILEQIDKLERQRALLIEGSANTLEELGEPTVTNQSSEEEKISLFRTLFRGREDVYARRYENVRTGKTGYFPASQTKGGRAFGGKANAASGDLNKRDFLPLTDAVIRNHLLGRDPQSRSLQEFTIGIYPLLPDETCWFLAVDFDKSTWVEDASAFLEICQANNVPASLERSRSGEGAHIWLFFSEPIPARLARQLGSVLLTETMERRPEIGLESYDRFFPNQDTMPKGGFGNLIALPLQKSPRENGNTVFLDTSLVPYPDQWAYLSSVHRMNRAQVEEIVQEAESHTDIYGVTMAVTEDDDLEPWLAPPSRRREPPPIAGPLPEQMKIILGNQIYLAKADLSPSLQNRLIRLAAFQNPEFYKAQAMRFSTYGKHRMINCSEDFAEHIGIPRGCQDEVIRLLRSLEIKLELTDERFTGTPVDLQFQGKLRPDQQKAADALLRHDIGVLSATTGFGKTVIAAYMIAERGVNTIVLVHRRQLLDQWIAHLGNFLGLDPKEIGQIGGGKRKPTGLIDVAMIQSLSKHGEVDDLVGEYGYLVADECHHISARSFEIVARQSKVKFVTGLSATVTRRDGHHPIIFMQCGPVRYRLDERKQAEKRPFIHKVIVRETGFKLPERLMDEPAPSIHELYAALISDDGRNRLIVDDVLAAVRTNRSPVLLTERREHLTILHDLLSPLIPNLIVMKGGMGKKQRLRLADRIASIPDTEERVILATGRYLGEGFDDARLDTLFLSLPISWRGTLIQYAGRLHRLHDMKREVIIYDYADLEVPMLVKMFQRRCRGYRAIGYVLEE